MSSTTGSLPPTPTGPSISARVPGRRAGESFSPGRRPQLWAEDTATGRFFSLRERVAIPGQRPAPKSFLTVRGAHLRNLQEIDVPIPIGRLTVITGVSGSGKSTFVEDVLVASLNDGKPVGCRAVEGPPIKPVFVDQSPIGHNPRSNPATYTKLADIIRDLFCVRQRACRRRTFRSTGQKAPVRPAKAWARRK